MKPVVVVRHEGPDRIRLAEDVFAESGLRVAYVDLWRDHQLPSPADVAALVFLGGTMGVGDSNEFPFLAAEQDLIREAVRQSIPLLGLCLGAQLLAAATGGKVFRAAHRSIGFLPVAKTLAAESDGLFRGFCATDRLLSWHQDTFTLPPGSQLLMSSDDTPNQAFRVGACAWGAQFHFEADQALFENWIESSRELLPSTWGITTGALVEGARSYLPHQQTHARQAFKALAELAIRRSERGVGGDGVPV
jgi:GMP synthase (glutamine-hydrolysing)